MEKNFQKKDNVNLKAEVSVDAVGDIGSTAGKVYIELSKAKAPKEMEELKRLVNSKEMQYHMAIGWLAREDKLKIEKNNGTTILSLKG